MIEATQKMQAFDTVGLGPIHVKCGMEFSTDFQEVNKRRLLAEDINIASRVGVVILYYLLLNALSRRRREVNHVSFACAIPHVIIKFVA